MTPLVMFSWATLFMILASQRTNSHYDPFRRNVISEVFGNTVAETESIILALLLKLKRSAFRFQKSIQRAPGRCMTFLHAPPVRACLGLRCGRLLRRLRGRDRRSSRHCGLRPDCVR